MATPFAVLRRFAVGELITLYEVDLSALGGTVYYFTNNIFDSRLPITFNGNVYTHLPCDMDGIEVGNDSGPAQPKFRLATAGGPIASLIATYRDLRGAKVWRKKTFAEFLDQQPSLEHVLNGTFSTDTANWNTNINDGTATLSQVGGRMRLTTNAAAVKYAYQLINGLTVGETYAVKGTLFGGATAGQAVLNIGTTNGNSQYAQKAAAPGVTASMDTSFVATQTSVYVSCWVNTPTIGAYAEFDNLSIINTSGRSIGIANPSADGSAIVSKELYVVDRKLAANPTFAEFQLVSPMDQEGVEIPLRIVRKRWCDRAYRQRNGAAWLNFDPVDGGCPFRGTSYFTEDDQPTADPAQDKCSKLLTGCKLRFGNAVGLPFSGFPGVRGAGEA